MEDITNNILDTPIVSRKAIRRRSLLPWWMRVFTWLFLLGGPVALLGIVLGLLGMQFQMAIYGLQSTDPLSLTGLFIVAIFLIKGITAFGLWWEKEWAITAGQVDALSGIAVCTVIMILPFIGNHPGFKMTFKVELLLLVPYLAKLSKIKEKWINAAQAKQFPL